MNVEYGTEFDVKKQIQISAFNNAILECFNINCVADMSNTIFGEDSYYFIIDRNRVNKNFSTERSPNLSSVFLIN